GNAGHLLGVQETGEQERAAGDDAQRQKQQQDGPAPASATAARLPVVGVVVLDVRVLRGAGGERGAHTGGGDDVVEAACRCSHRGELSGGGLVHRDAVQGVLHGVVELLGRLEAHRRVFGERLGDHRLHGGGDLVV